MLHGVGARPSPVHSQLQLVSMVADHLGSLLCTTSRPPYSTLFRHSPPHLLLPARCTLLLSRQRSDRQAYADPLGNARTGRRTILDHPRPQVSLRLTALETRNRGRLLTGQPPAAALPSTARHRLYLHFLCLLPDDTREIHPTRWKMSKG